MQAGSTQVQRRLLRGSEVALMLGVALPRVRGLVREGKLEAVRIGQSRLAPLPRRGRGRADRG
jgi:excisionase family DNA binding protein